MRLTLFFIAAITLTSCGDASSEVTSEWTEVQKTSVENIKELEKVALGLPMNSAADVENLKRTKLQLIDSLLNYYRSYPKDTLAPGYLDKVHMLYSGMGEYRTASTYAEMILNQYPNYVNRQMVIESQIVNYDIFITPRNADKVKQYVELMLKEKELSPEVREEYELRLQNIDKSLLD
ncbi:MAG: hypothetical protein ACO2Z9_07920 [Crocinitomicaceae bacterium]